MITPQEIEKATMTEEKWKTAHYDFFAFYVGRPISYVVTIPFLYTNISPNMVSIISIIPLFIGLILSYFANNILQLLLTWLMFFIWNILDGVDGNIARYKKQFSRLGSVYDAMSGYMAACLTFLCMGIVASHHGDCLPAFLMLNDDIYLILGGLSAIFVIFPRLIMHKAITTTKDYSLSESVNDRMRYGWKEIIALNLRSSTGGAQVLMLIAIIFHFEWIYTIFYFLLNTAIMLVSLKRILSEKNNHKKQD